MNTIKRIPAYRSTGYLAPSGRYVPPVLFSPYTGEPRDARDIQSDPQGMLIVPPGAELAAYVTPAQRAEASAADAPPAGFVSAEAYDRLHAHAESLAARILGMEDADSPAALSTKARTDALKGL